MTTLWVSIVVGLLIVLLAVGTPYWLTHRRRGRHHDLSHAHHDLSDARAYLDATGKTPEDAAAGRPGRRWRRRSSAGRRPRAPASAAHPQAGRPAGPQTGEPPASSPERTDAPSRPPDGL